MLRQFQRKSLHSLLSAWLIVTWSFALLHQHHHDHSYHAHTIVETTSGTAHKHQHDHDSHSHNLHAKCEHHHHHHSVHHHHDEATLAHQHPQQPDSSHEPDNHNHDDCLVCQFLAVQAVTPQTLDLVDTGEILISLEERPAISPETPHLSLRRSRAPPCFA